MQNVLILQTVSMLIMYASADLFQFPGIRETDIERQMESKGVYQSFVLEGHVGSLRTKCKERQNADSRGKTAGQSHSARRNGLQLELLGVIVGICLIEVRGETCNKDRERNNAHFFSFEVVFSHRTVQYPSETIQINLTSFV